MKKSSATLYSKLIRIISRFIQTPALLSRKMGSNFLNVKIFCSAAAWRIADKSGSAAEEVASNEVEILKKIGRRLQSWMQTLWAEIYIPFATAETANLKTKIGIAMAMLAEMGAEFISRKNGAGCHGSPGKLRNEIDKNCCRIETADYWGLLTNKPTKALHPECACWPPPQS